MKPARGGVLQPPVGPAVEITLTPTIDRVRIARVVAILRDIMDTAERSREGRRS